MQIRLGLDGGGTGCRAQARLPDGRLTPVFTGGPANVYSDPDGAIEQIRTLAHRTLEAARALAPSMQTDRPQVRAVLGLAGASETDAAPQLQAALGFDSMKVLGDLEIALIGAFRSDDGIIAALGTGSAFARQVAGQMRRIGGYGFVLGDEGSGAWLGRAALARALHARDGLIAPGPLTDALWRDFGTLAAMLAFARGATPAQFAARAPLILDCAAQGCPVARGLLDDASADVARAIAALQPVGALLPVALVGGLGDALAGHLSAGGALPWPRHTPLGTPLEGALWLASH